MTIDRRTVWTAATLLLCLAVAALGWMFLISPQRTTASDLASQREGVDSSATTLSARLASLKQQSLELTARRTELAAIHKQLPTEIDVTALVASVVALGKSSGVTVTSLSPGSLAPVTGAAATTATAAGGTVQQMTLSMAVSGEYFETSLFLKRLQTQLPQAFLVDTLSVSGGDTSTLTVQGRIFTLPASA